LALARTSAATPYSASPDRTLAAIERTYETHQNPKFFIGSCTQADAPVRVSDRQLRWRLRADLRFLWLGTSTPRREQGRPDTCDTLKLMLTYVDRSVSSLFLRQETSWPVTHPRRGMQIPDREANNTRRLRCLEPPDATPNLERQLAPALAASSDHPHAYLRIRFDIAEAERHPPYTASRMQMQGVYTHRVGCT
jgi:hypothetical protein